MAMLSVGTTVAPGIAVTDVHAGGDVIWSTGEVIAVGGMAAVLVTWLYAELRRARSEEAIDAEALDLQASMWRVSRILAKTEAEKASERAAALAAATVPARSRGSMVADAGSQEPGSAQGTSDINRELNS
jgi:hypothetical protein